VTVTDCKALPPLPEQFNENVLVLASALVGCESLATLLPDQAPDAVQELASVEDHVSVEDPPCATDIGFAASDTVGTASGVPPPPQAASARAAKGTSGNVFFRNMGIPIP
jgi:hypothetical protein